MPTFNGSESVDDTFAYNVSTDGAVSRDFGAGYDVVTVSGDPSVTQVRLSFTSAQVGNGNPNDSNSMANQDGGLAVRLQAENGTTDTLTGPVSRFDDEGISFIASGNLRFDVRDLVSGVGRGQNFEVVRLGTSAGDVYSETASVRNTYINAGMGDDFVYAGLGDDFLVGGGGNDRLDGNEGNDSFIGGAGDDSINGGAGDDVAIVNISTDGADSVKLGGGNDRVTVSAAAGVTQARLTFTSAEVGNNAILDSNTLANQDGGNAVRLQAEDGAGALTGSVGRYDDELITFVASGDLTFDIRDLVSGVERGDQFKVATLGSGAADVIDFTGRTVTYYVNGGRGNDVINGGEVADFLVGGLGNDRINGGRGDDSFIGGAGTDTFIFVGRAGNDRILDFVSGTDKIDLSSYGIDFGDLTIYEAGGSTFVGVDTNDNGRPDYTITLVGTQTQPPASDFLF